MANPITYSFDVAVTKATKSVRLALLEFVEPSTGVKEATFTANIGPSSTESIALGDISVGTAVLVNAKPDGGVDDVNMVLQITNAAATGVASGSQDVRFGSFILIADANFSALSIKNLDTLNAVSVQIYVLGN